MLKVSSLVGICKICQHIPLKNHRKTGPLSENIIIFVGRNHKLGNMNRILLIALFLMAITANAKKETKPVKFLYMSDIHFEDDFQERGKPIFTMWKPGNHAALRKTFEFINKDPYCSTIDFGLFGGDQLNTGYFYHEESMKKEMEIYRNTIPYLDIYSKTLGKNIKDLDFHYRKQYICKENLAKGQEPVTFTAPDLKSRLIVIQGNHDTCMPDFYRECAWTSGDVRFIAFFAAYVGLPAPPGKFLSTGKIRDESVDFVEKEMKAAAANKKIRHIVLVCHWGIADGSSDFKCAIKDACESNKFNNNRQRILSLAEKYGCDLYINGHEHNSGFPVAKVGNLNDINCGTVTNDKYSWSIVEIHHDKCIFNIYSRANAIEKEDGTIEYNQLPTLTKTVTIQLKPIR